MLLTIRAFSPARVLEGVVRGLSGEIIKREWYLVPGEGAGMTVVHWARHGENVANVSRTFSYRVFDGDLTERGIAQARFLAGRLHAAAGRGRYEVLVCSPLRRARQTARIVSAALGLPVAAELDDLREVNVGELDGRADDSAWQVYEATLTAWRSGQLGRRFPGGESAEELAARTRRALCDIAARAGEAGAVVIAHGASIRAAVPVLTGQPDPGSDLPTGEVASLSVTTGHGTAAQITLTAWGQITPPRPRPEPAQRPHIQDQSAGGDGAGSSSGQA